MNNLEFALIMQKRTKAFAIQIVLMCRRLPRTEDARVFSRQLLRSVSSVAANYRAACRAKSRADFICKIATTTEEADETVFWLEMLEEAGLVKAEHVVGLKTEGEEIVRILSASLSTAKNSDTR